MLLTRPPLPLVPKNRRTFDLHVLGTPPAFILSQDQTRHPCCIWLHHTLHVCCRQCSSVRELRSRPSCLWLHLAVRRFSLRLSSLMRGRISLTGTAVFVYASTQLLFCFPLFNCQGTTRSKSCLLLCRILKTDIQLQEHLHFIKERRSWGQFLRRNP